MPCVWAHHSSGSGRRRSVRSLATGGDTAPPKEGHLKTKHEMERKFLNTTTIHYHKCLMSCRCRGKGSCKKTEVFEFNWILSKNLGEAVVVVPINLHKDTISVDPSVMFKQLFSVSCKFTVTFWVGSACNCASIENLKWKMTGGGL